MKLYFRNILKKAFVFGFLILALPGFSLAREAGEIITDWYVKDFQSTIIVNKDSSLLIEEKITADCGNLPDKHGIFRVLPLRFKTEAGEIKTPVRLVSITDFNGKTLPHSTIRDRASNTIAWKIGDPKKTVAGENYYKITYIVENAINFANPEFDEFYWNLIGNFWVIDIDNFSIDISFPEEVNKNNAKVSYYSGIFGSAESEGVVNRWKTDNILNFSSLRSFKAGEGLAASISFPKNIFTPYKPGIFDEYGKYLWLLVPLFSFIFCFYLWLKYGKDPKVKKAVVPEFEPPANLTPLEMGALAGNGDVSSKLFSASIIYLAVKKYIVIEQIERAWYLGGKDFKLKKIKPEEEFLSLPFSEKVLIEKMFKEKKEVFLSLLKTSFYKEMPSIQKAAAENLALKSLISEKGRALRKAFFAVSSVYFISGAFLFLFFQTIAGLLAMTFSGIIILLFAKIMPKRTPKGAELNWRIKGFKMYMEKAEAFRQRFNEKENIFEDLLPYAMVFGIAKLWAEKMEEIYGKEYFQSYHPIWLAGTTAGSFDADSFNSQIKSISSGISSATGTSSGSGSSGGGRGGGGGGGW